MNYGIAFKDYVSYSRLIWTSSYKKADFRP